MLVKDMIVGRWYEGYGMTVECMGLMASGKFMLVAIDGDKDMQSTEGWPLDKEVVEINNPYERK